MHWPNAPCIWNIGIFAKFGLKIRGIKGHNVGKIDFFPSRTTRYTLTKVRNSILIVFGKTQKNLFCSYRIEIFAFFRKLLESNFLHLLVCSVSSLMWTSLFSLRWAFLHLVIWAWTSQECLYLILGPFQPHLAYYDRTFIMHVIFRWNIKSHSLTLHSIVSRLIWYW